MIVMSATCKQFTCKQLYIEHIAKIISVISSAYCTLQEHILVEAIHFKIFLAPIHHHYVSEYFESQRKLPTTSRKAVFSKQAVLPVLLYHGQQGMLELID